MNTAEIDDTVYPLRRHSFPKGVDKMAFAFEGYGRRLAIGAYLARLRRFAAAVDRLESETRASGDAELRESAAALGLQMRKFGFRLDLATRSFALVREAARRTVGMVHYGVQVMAGLALLEGKVAELATGEGKTLAATMPAATAALAGIPVHVLSVNDYLTGRDAEWMGPVYHALGLSVGCVTTGLTPEQRRAAYCCDITYSTDKEVLFDYLRDCAALGPRRRRSQLAAERIYHPHPRVRQCVLRGLHYAIVDEADNVLIDEAKTPAILSAADAGTREDDVFQQAIEVVDQLEPGIHYRVDLKERQVSLTEEGWERLSVIGEHRGGFWRGLRRGAELVTDTLCARYLFEKDKHYLVRDGKVVIVDEYTGRTMPDRKWSLGLHEAVEAKEKVALTGLAETLTQTTYQNFFRRYLKLAGMTGTAWEVARELWSVYRLTVIPIPPRLPCRRRSNPARIFVNAEEKWIGVAARVRELHLAGRPVLVGTRSVADSERLSHLLEEMGQPHRVLNARQDRAEAEVVALAGQRGRITVATNMAGRGTDIKLGDNIVALGGLHVMATELHESGRIDRQLYGRCARQGDPGSCEAFLSFEDELVERYAPAWVRSALALMLRRLGYVPRRAALFLFSQAQKSAELMHRQMRASVLKHDEELRKTLGFSGGAE